MGLPSKGLYKATIKQWGLTKAKTGNYQFTVRFKVTSIAVDPDVPADKIEWVPLEVPLTRTIFDTITEKTKDRVLEDVQALGFPEGRDILDLDPKLSDTPFDFSDKEFHTYCDHDEYRGNVRDKWSISRRRGVESITKSDAEQLRNLFGTTFTQVRDTESADDYFRRQADRQLTEGDKDAIRERLAGVPY